MAHIYGIDTKNRITALMVRDAMVQCFYKAHCEASGVESDEEINRLYCREVVKKAFDSSGGKFENTTSESIKKAMDHLAEFSKGFRDQSIIRKHYVQLLKLVMLLDK